MKLSIVRIAMMIAILGWSSAAALAQTEPQAKTTQKEQANEKIKEYELSLEEIHSRAANRNKWSTTQSAVWSDRQCRSCHAANHNITSRTQLLFAQATVANSLGIEVAPLDGTLRAHLNIDEKSGLVLSGVPEGCEGAKLGLKLHDIVLSIDTQPVNEPAKFNELLGSLGGKQAHVNLLRQGKPLTLELAIPQVPQAVVADVDVAGSFDLLLGRDAWTDDRYRIGVTLSEADETLRSHLKLATGEGLVVTEVVDDSPAAKMGVKQHDVLIELDGKRLSTVDAVNAQIQELKDKTVLLKLLRSGQEVTCQIAPKKSSEPRAALQELVLVDDQEHRQAIVRWLGVSNKAEGASNADAAAQLAELKKQLAELSKTVEKLEAVIVPPTPPADEKQPENRDKE